MAKNDPWLPPPLRQLSQEVDRLFDELIHRPWGASRRASEAAWTPQLDLYEDAKSFVLEADLPGVQEKDISVTVEDSDLVLQGKRTFERVCNEDDFYCRERRSGEFLRRLRLPASVNLAKIHAEFRDGVLRVTLPKVQQERKAQR
ncbi:MAG TPA: Hsp20/alpha crystallin family protein [Methylomirabilota bacterium]|jgi:HSP20 family protein|nr:Hsp20/alpha crystallin family protein [Methylomirabilota bacterium]